MGTGGRMGFIRVELDVEAMGNASVRVANRQAPSYRVNRNRMTILLPAADTDASFSVVHVVARSSPPFHAHQSEDELFYVLEGNVTFHGSDGELAVSPGSAVYVPRGTPHTFRVTAGETARWLLVFQPGGFEEFFADVGRPIDETDRPDYVEVSTEAMRDAASEYDLEILGPPPS